MIRWRGRGLQIVPGAATEGLRAIGARVLAMRGHGRHA
jgi:hypothetical protein